MGLGKELGSCTSSELPGWRCHAGGAGEGPGSEEGSTAQHLYCCLLENTVDSMKSMVFH